MNTAKKQYVPSLSVKLFVILLLAILVVFPVVRMFASISAGDFKAVIGSPLFGEALLNSVFLSLIATLISIVIAYLLAWCTVRTNIAFKKGWNIIFTLPMLIPSISHGMGLIILFGGNGIIKNLLDLNGTVYGSVGIIIGSVLYAFPVAYIMLADVLRYEDMSVYEAAGILGLSRARQFFKITLPYMKKPLIAASFSVFSMIVTDYGVPLMIGGKIKTISLMMYEEVIGRLDFGKGCVYGLFLLVPAIVAFIADLVNKDKAPSAFVKREVGMKNGALRHVIAYIVCVVVALLAILPILAFLVLAFASSYPRDMSFTLSNIIDTLNRNGATYLINSLIIALGTAILGTALAYIAAYLTSRMRSKMSRVLHLLLLTFMAIPGIVLGLSYVVSFSGSFIYGTLVIMIMVNLAHFISSPYILMYNSFGKMNEQLEAVGATLGVSRLRMIKDVFIPQNISSIAEMFSYLFVNCMMTISAVSFLANVNTKPLSLMINQFEAQMQYECAAVVSLMILAANIVVKIIVAVIKHFIERRKREHNDVIDQKAI